jgi:hypothetical protein
VSRIFAFLGVHVRGFESLNLGGQWWCSAWSSVSLLLFGDQWWCSAWSWAQIFEVWAVNGGVVHGRGFESLTFWALPEILKLTFTHAQTRPERATLDVL